MPYLISAYRTSKSIENTIMKSSPDKKFKLCAAPIVHSSKFITP